MYTVRIPFLVPPATRVSEQDALTTRASLAFKLTWEGYYHVLTASGFANEDEAGGFLASAKSAFACLLLQKGVAAEANLVPQAIRYHPDPIEAGKNLSRSSGGADLGPIDTIIDGAQAAIYESDKRVRKATGLPLTAHTTVPSDKALSVLVEGALLPRSQDVAEDEKLGVALALYGAFFTEQSAKARYLTLIMSLESLATATTKSQLALELLQKWSRELDSLLNGLQPNSDEAGSLEALRRELFFRQEDSIRQQIRKLVRSTLEPHTDAAEQARIAVELYDLRSTLVHEGVVDSRTLDEAIPKARAIVQRTLRARFDAIAQIPHQQGA